MMGLKYRHPKPPKINLIAPRHIENYFRGAIYIWHHEIGVCQGVEAGFAEIAEARRSFC